MTTNIIYQEDIKEICNLDLPWERFDDAIVLITGSTGLLGRMLVDVLLERRAKYGQKIHLILNGRNEEKLVELFGKNKDDIVFLSKDISDDISNEFADQKKIDYIFHLAGTVDTTYCREYPTKVMQLATCGMINLCNLGLKKDVKGILNLSSIGVYGKQPKDRLHFTEDSFYGMDCGNVSLAYSEGKRAAEMIGSSYYSQYSLPIFHLRLCKTFGPTCNKNADTVFYYFIQKAVNGEMAELHSKGMQKFSYAYVADAVAGMLYCILKGKAGEAYNLGNATDEKTTTLREYVGILEKQFDLKVKDCSDEQTDQSADIKGIMNSEKLENLGWKKRYSIEEGLRRTVLILRDLK